MIAVARDVIDPVIGVVTHAGLRMSVGVVVVMVRVIMGLVRVHRRLGLAFRGRSRLVRFLATAPTVPPAMLVAVAVIEIGRGRGAAGPHRGTMLCDQGLPVRDRNLIVVGMDFVEGEEAVPAPAVVYEGRLQRRLDADDLGKVDIALELLLGRGFDVKVFETRPIQHDHTRLFRVRRVDQHTLDHSVQCSAMPQTARYAPCRGQVVG